MIAEDLTYFVLDDHLRMVLSQTLVGKTWDELLAEEETQTVKSSRPKLHKHRSIETLPIRSSLTDRKPLLPYRSHEKIVEAELRRDKKYLSTQKSQILN
jgi:hypothetical protein